MNMLKKFSPLFLFGAALLWSIASVFTKSTEWNGICLSALRGYIALPVAFALLRFKFPKPSKLKLAAAFCYFAQGVLYICATQYTTAANAIVLQNTSPLYIILMNALILKCKPARSEIFVCAVLFAGVSMAFIGNMSGGGALGNILALLSAMFYAGVFFLNGRSGAEPLESLFFGNACYLIVLPLFLTSPAVLHTSTAEWSRLIPFAVLSGIGAWLCFTVGIRHTDPLRAGFITMSETVLAPLWTFIFLGETISPLSLLGCGVVLTTLMIYNLQTARSSGRN